MSTSSLTSDSAHQPRRGVVRRLLKGTLILAVALLLLAAVCLGAFGIYQQQRHSRAVADIEAEIARIRAAGEPLTAEEMARFHQVPAGVPDTTPLWLKATSLVEPHLEQDRAILSNQGKYDLDKLGQDGPENWLAEAEQLLELRQDVIDAGLAAAEAEGQARFPIDFSEGYNALLPHFQPLRELSKLFQLRHRVAVVRQDQETALESLDALFAIQSSLAHQPGALDQLLRLSVIGMIHSELQRLINSLEFSEEELAELQAKLHRVDLLPGARLGMLGERAIGYHAFMHNAQIDPDSESLELILGPEEDFPPRAIDCAYYLAAMREQLECTAKSPAEGWYCFTRIQNGLTEIDESGFWWQREEVTLSRLLLSSYLHPFLPVAQARLDTARAAIAMRRFQLRHDRIPTDLAELVPEFLNSVPQDPFYYWDEPLQVVREQDRIAVFSNGLNQQSDLAVLTDPDTEEDVGFVLMLGRQSEVVAPDAKRPDDH